MNCIGWLNAVACNLCKWAILWERLRKVYRGSVFDCGRKVML